MSVTELMMGLTVVTGYAVVEDITDEKRGSWTLSVTVNLFGVVRSNVKHANTSERSVHVSSEWKLVVRNN